mmetsp:Transcript_21894/g.62073  ORF Transcript_21894/g.62073 Transcript_21894/m.62073 type:complete len:305 (-) Transcript_21894:307-1221(-)
MDPMDPMDPMDSAERLPASEPESPSSPSSSSAVPSLRVCHQSRQNSKHHLTSFCENLPGKNAWKCSTACVPPIRSLSTEVHTTNGSRLLRDCSCFGCSTYSRMRGAQAAVPNKMTSGLRWSPSCASLSKSMSSSSSSASKTASDSTPACVNAVDAAKRHTGSVSAAMMSSWDGSNVFHAASWRPWPKVHHFLSKSMASSKNAVLIGLGSTTWKLPFPSSTVTCRWMDDMQTTKGSRRNKRFFTSSWICSAHSRPSIPGMRTSSSTSKGMVQCPSICNFARCSSAPMPLSASWMFDRTKPTLSNS